jgi:hypothetical protein
MAKKSEKKTKTKKPKKPRQLSEVEVSLSAGVAEGSPRNNSSERHNLVALTSAKTASTRIISARGKPVEYDRYPLAGMHVSRDIADEILQNFLKADDNSEITFSRKFGVWMSQFDWYCPKGPHKNNPNPPSLNKA